MSGPLKGITSSMSMMISTMEQMQRATNRNVNVDKSLIAAKKQIAAAEAAMKSSIDQSTSSQNKFNRSIKEGKSHGEGLLRTIKGIAATYLTLEGVKSLFGATIGGSMEQQKMEDMFIARTGDARIGTAMFEQFKKDALAAGQDVNKSLQGTLSFFSTTQNTDHLKQLNNLAQRMNAFDSAGNGIEGATFALKEAMSGDIVSLAERFNMSKTDIRDFGIDKLGKAGDMEGFIKAFDKLLEKQKMGQKAFDTMMASPAKQVETLGNNIRSTFADAGGAAVQSLLPLITKVNEAFKDGAFQPFFDGLSIGLEWVVQGAVNLVNMITQIYGFFSTNWTMIEPIVWGLAGAVTALYTIMLLTKLATISATAATVIQTLVTFAQMTATYGLTTAWATLNTVMKANVIILMISLLIALGVWLVNLWNTNDAFAAGFMRAWNGIMNFFDQVPIFFVQVGNGIVNAFQWAKVETLKIIDGLANGVIDTINKLLNTLSNTIPGVSFDTVARIELASSAAAESEAIRQSGQNKVTGMQANAAGKAQAREQKVLDMLKGRAEQRAVEDAAKKAQASSGTDKFNFDKWNKAADAAQKASGDDKKKKNIGTVDKIKGKVDISSEDLKVMRDLAEMKNIQNFVTLTPTVQVKTGPISNETNLDSIVSKITTKLQDDIASSAKGVFS